MMTSTKLRRFLPALLAGSLAMACSDDDDGGKPDATVQSDAGPDAGPSRTDAGLDSGGGSVSPEASTGTDAARGDAGILTPSQVVGVLQAVNTGEIATAELALMKPAQNPQVLAYANDMKTMHQAANQMLLSFGATATSPEEVAVTMTATTLGTTLTETPAGPAFDAAYINGQVTAHQTALTLIDTKLIPSASGQLLTALMTMVRPMVAEHGARALTIANSLSDTSADAGARDAGADAGATDAGGADAAPDAQ